MLCAFNFDGRGGGTALNWEDISSLNDRPGLVWLHLDYENDHARDWLINQSGLDELVCNALLASEPRPRSFVHGDGLLVILRGVNLNPGAEPDDMVSVRVWMQSNRIITLRHRRIMAINDLREAIHDGHGPLDAGDFMVQLIERLLIRMEEVIASLDEKVDELEESVIDMKASSLRTEIGQLRRLAIGLRRYIAPQRQAMSRLITEDVTWFSELTRAHLREFADRLTRYVEDLDSARERAAVAQDELNSRVSERMNQTMYLISVCTAIFLPLGLLTGLLGINVGGMPGVENDFAFWSVCGLLVTITAVSVALLKVKKWF